MGGWSALCKIRALEIIGVVGLRHCSRLTARQQIIRRVEMLPGNLVPIAGGAEHGRFPSRTASRRLQIARACRFSIRLSRVAVIGEQGLAGAPEPCRGLDCRRHQEGASS